MTIAQIKKNMKHGDYNILQKLLKLSTESAARQNFLRGDKDAVEGMIKIQENRSIFCDLHADEDCSCHDDLKEAINQKADKNHSHDWNEITGKPTEFPPTHHSHNVRDIEGLDDVLHTIDDLRNLSTQKLDRDGSNATGSLASTINNNHNHVNKAILDTITSSKVNDWDNAASKAHNAVILGSNATGLTITNQVLQFSNGYQLPTTIKVSEWDDAYLKRHTHGNKAVLDNLTQSVIDQSHAHSNKSVIDGITTQMVNNWNGSFVNNHTHNNKSTLDGISSADVTNWDTAHANNHTHANKVILDAISAAYTVAEKNKLATIQQNAQVNVKADWNAISGDAEVLNKPTSFTPSPHNHAISDVAGLQSELDSKLEAPHLNGFVHDVAYNSSLHTLTFYQRNEPNIVIDLPIEHLIKGVQLHGNDLVFTFEGGSNVTVPMNTLLVGVVKSVNGLTANSQGEVVLDITDIPGLQNALDRKANIDGGNLTNIANWKSILDIDSISNTLPNKANVNGNNLVSISSWQNSLDILTKESMYVVADCNIINLGRGLVQPTTLNAPANYGELVTTQTSSWIYQTFYDTDNRIWHRQNINSGGFTPWLTITDDSVLLNYAKIDGSNLININNWQSVLGINTALDLGLQEITNNNPNTNKTINARSYSWNVGSSQPIGIVTTEAVLHTLFGGNLAYGISTNNNGGFDIMSNQDGQPIRLWAGGNNTVPILSAVFNGRNANFTGNLNIDDTIYTANHGTSANWNQAYLATQNLSNNYVSKTGDVMSGTLQLSTPGQYLILQGHSLSGNYSTYRKYDGSKDIAYIGSDGGSAFGGGVGDRFGVRAVGDLLLGSDTGIIDAFSEIRAPYLKIGQTAGTGQGISLYDGNPNNPEYGLMFATTGNYGTMGSVNGDWATYFTMAGASNRGWVFRHQGIGNVASINGEGVISTMYHGNSGQWQSAWVNGLVNRGDIYTSNIDLNNLPIENRIAGIHTGNGSGNVNFPGYMNGSYGIHTRTVGGAFTTDTVFGNGGEMWYKTWYHPSGANGTDWRKVWDNVNLSDPATQTWVNSNFASNAGLNNKANIDGSNTVGGIWDIKAVISSNLTGISGNGQIFNQSGNNIYWGNPLLGGHTIEMATDNALIVYSSQSGTSGKVWHELNFNPANYALTSALPTNNNQLSNGSGYITASALSGYASQSWVNSQGFLTSASLPNVSNATVTYQGTGAITGGGSHTINQSGNSAYNFDLTNQTKNEISLGVNAYNSLSSKQDTLVAGSGISIVGNTISATNGGGGSGIGRIFTDNSSQSGPADEQSGVIFTSHEAYGLPQAEYKHEGNATIAIEDPKTLHLFSSYDSVHTIQTSGNNVHIDIDSIRAHIYNVVKFQAGSNHISVSFPNGIYAGDQINISAQRGTMIYINTPNLISSVGAEIPSHANLVWDPGLQAWVVKSFGY